MLDHPVYLKVIKRMAPTSFYERSTQKSWQVGPGLGSCCYNKPSAYYLCAPKGGKLIHNSSPTKDK